MSNALVFPGCGVEYSVTDLLKAAMLRSDVAWNIRIDRIVFSHKRLVTENGSKAYEDGSHDAWLEFIFLIEQGDEFTDTLYGKITGFFPIHVTYQGGMKVGHATEEIKPPSPVKIFFEGIVNNEKSNVTLMYSEITDEIKEMVIDLIKEYQFRDHMVNGESIEYHEITY